MWYTAAMSVNVISQTEQSIKFLYFLKGGLVLGYNLTMHNFPLVYGIAKHEQPLLSQQAPKHKIIYEHPYDKMLHRTQFIENEAAIDSIKSMSVGEASRN